MIAVADGRRILFWFLSFPLNISYKMQPLRRLTFQRALNRSLFINNKQSRCLSLTRPCWNENTTTKEQPNSNTIEKFRKYSILIGFLLADF